MAWPMQETLPSPVNATVGPDLHVVSNDDVKFLENVG